MLFVSVFSATIKAPVAQKTRPLLLHSWYSHLRSCSLRSAGVCTAIIYIYIFELLKPLIKSIQFSIMCPLMMSFISNSIIFSSVFPIYMYGMCSLPSSSIHFASNQMVLVIAFSVSLYAPLSRGEKVSD